MTLMKSCEKHAPKEVLSYFEKTFSCKEKCGIVTN